jgi:hypothetical protein
VSKAVQRAAAQSTGTQHGGATVQGTNHAEGVTAEGTTCCQLKTNHQWYICFHVTWCQLKTNHQVYICFHEDQSVVHAALAGLPCVDLAEGPCLIWCCERLPVAQPEVAAAPVTVAVCVPGATMGHQQQPAEQQHHRVKGWFGRFEPYPPPSLALQRT